MSAALDSAVLDSSSSPVATTARARRSRRQPGRAHPSAGTPSAGRVPVDRHLDVVDRLPGQYRAGPPPPQGQPAGPTSSTLVHREGATASGPHVPPGDLTPATDAVRDRPRSSKARPSIHHRPASTAATVSAARSRAAIRRSMSDLHPIGPGPDDERTTQFAAVRDRHRHPTAAPRLRLDARTAGGADRTGRPARRTEHEAPLGVGELQRPPSPGPGRPAGSPGNPPAGTTRSGPWRGQPASSVGVETIDQAASSTRVDLWLRWHPAGTPSVLDADGLEHPQAIGERMQIALAEHPSALEARYLHHPQAGLGDAYVDEGLHLEAVTPQHHRRIDSGAADASRSIFVEAVATEGVVAVTQFGVAGPVEQVDDRTRARSCPPGGDG